MRTLMRVTMDDVVAGNKAIKDGSLPKVMEATMKRIKPEAAYFYTTTGGHRACSMVFDLKDTSDIPVIAEPLFMTLNARVEFLPVMNDTDLKKGLQKWMKSKG